MTLEPFQLERFFGRYEFTTRYLLCASDCETLSIGELLELAGAPPAALTDLRLGYTESQGDPELRAAIAGLYQSVPAAGVVVTNAPEEAIFVTLHALLRPGARVVVLTPCYQSLAEVARHLGCEVVPWRLVETERGWSLDLDRLDGLLAAPTELLILNFPHNPTGFQPGREQFEAVVELAGRRGARIFSDEMYRGLEHGAPQLPSAPDLDERAIALWGTSKSFGLPGLRIGWLALRDEALVRRLLEVKDYTTICSSAPGEVLARLAVEHAAKLFELNLALIARNLSAMDDFLGRHPRLLDWRQPQAGPLSFSPLRAGAATDLARRAREEAGVLLMPSPIFDWGDRHLRWGLGRANFHQGLARLETWLGKGGGGQPEASCDAARSGA